jgi:hypothetical protein
MSTGPQPPNPSLERRTRFVAMTLALVVVGSAVLGWRLLDAVDVEHQELEGRVIRRDIVGRRAERIAGRP